MTKPISSKPNVCKRIFIVGICMLFFATSFGQVGISTTSITPNSSSILELRSTTLGFLPPRMTTTERDAIASPANGLVIYNTTTSLLNFYNGSSWQITGGSGVTSVSVTTANGISGTVANASTTPAITLTLGAITPTSVTATGAITGSNLSGTNTGDQTTITGNAGSATLTGITDDNTTAATMYPTWVTTNSGNQAQKVSSTKLSFNPSTGTLSSTAFVGNLTGNVTGNASTVTTNANLTGEVTSVGNTTTVTNASVIGKVLTGYVSGAGTIAPTDNILQAIQKLDGNKATNANLTGPITSVGNATSVASQTGTGSTFVMNTSPTLITPNLGTPTTLVGTNITGTASGLTAGNVTTNANLTGEVTSVGNTTTVTNASVIGKVLTGYVSGAGTIAPTDNILQAIQKLNGNNATNANLTGPITSIGNATSVASQTGTGSTFVMNTSPTLITPNLGTPTTLVGTNITGTASGLTAGNVTTNANLTGPITSTGNATSVASQTGTGSTFVMNTSPTLITPNLGTPTTLVGTNITGTASGLTAGNVTTNANLTGMVTSVGNATTVVTNANLTGEVTSVGNTATVPNATVIGKVLTGYTSGAGVISATDNILQAIQKLNGNNGTNANLTGPITSVGNATSIASQTGTGTTFVMNTSPTLITPNLGTPSAGVATNLTGTASGLTAGNVTTNANLTGEVTSVGNTTTVTNASVIAKVLTGYVSGAGTISATDNILQAIQKLNGNNATNANLTGPITSVGNATSVASQTGTGSTFVMNTSPTLITPNLGTPTTLVGTNITGTASGLTAGNVTTNANLTGEVTSVGNTTTVTNASVIGKVLTGFVSGAGTIAPTDNILQAIQKLDGNKATNANLTGPITSVGNATSVASQTGTGSTFVMNTSPTLVTPDLGTPSILIGTNITGTAPGLTAGNVTTNANLTGDVTSVGNATTIGSGKVTNSMLAGSIDLTTKVTNTLPVANGGTGQSAALVQGGVIYGSSTTATGTTSAGSAGQYLQSGGTGAPTWVSGSTIVTLGSDVVNNNAVANTMADVTGLSFAVTAGITYNFHALIIYTSAATTTGSRWSISGPASPTLLAYTSQYSLTATTNTNNNATAYDIPALSNASSATIAGNITIIDGIIKPSANGTVIIRFASEVLSSAITAKAGSTLTWW